MVFEFPFFGKQIFFWNKTFSTIFEIKFAQGGYERIYPNRLFPLDIELINNQLSKNITIGAMKRIVFKEFLEMIEEKFRYTFVDQVINESNLPNQEAYTPAGTYLHQEMISLAMSVRFHYQNPFDDLLRSFGNHLFGVFKKSYAFFFDKFTSAFDIFENIENHIHFEVKKIHSDMELTKFETERTNDNSRRMKYFSNRKMSGLAECLIASTLEHFHQKGSIKIEKVENEGKIVTFLIKTEG